MATPYLAERVPSPQRLFLRRVTRVFFSVMLVKAGRETRAAKVGEGVVPKDQSRCGLELPGFQGAESNAGTRSANRSEFLLVNAKIQEGWRRCVM